MIGVLTGAKRHSNVVLEGRAFPEMPSGNADYISKAQETVARVLRLADYIGMIARCVHHALTHVGFFICRLPVKVFETLLCTVNVTS